MGIPVNEPVLGAREREYVTQCVDTGWISSAGEFIEKFESRWAEYCGRKFGIAVSNGTTALELAVEALGLEAGDEVILPTFTIISCASAVVRTGARPVLVDADPETWCMDVSQVAEKVTPRTRAIMPVHIYGHPVDMDPLMELAEKRGIKVIEDAAEVHGAEYLAGRDSSNGSWRRCGSFGAASCFSFYGNKIVTTGEGGMILTDDADIAEFLRSGRNLCFQTGRRFYHSALGHNFRLTNIQAAIGLGQVEQIDKVLEKKRWIGRDYNRRLAGIKGLQLPVERPWAKNVYWMYGVVVDERLGIDANEFGKRLKSCGIDTRPFFLGMHEQPVFQRLGLFHDERYPVAERLARQGLYLPSGVGLTEEQLITVCDAVRTVLR